MKDTSRRLLKEVLVVLGGSDSFSETEIDWVEELAQASGASVTVLVILPPIPLVYGRFLQYSVPGLFQSTDPLSKKARWIADHFSDQRIKVTFKVRQGEPRYQLRYEVINSNPDMIFIAVGPNVWFRKVMYQDIFSPLLNFLNCPVMFAKHPDT